MKIDVQKADYSDSQHQRDIPALLDAYARDPMGGGVALNQQSKANLVQELAKLSHAFSVLVYVDGQAAGLANCFLGFSTFACKPLVNIHDLVVLEQYRGKGISHTLLSEVESIAVEMGCCKITLEVLSGNNVAKASYHAYGFAGYALDPASGFAEFWQKKLLQ